MRASDNLNIMTKVFLTYEDGSDGSVSVLGHGLFMLLRGVQSHGSINRAAKDLEMSYSKAWNLLKHSEERMGAPLIESSVPRGSRLTAQGAQLLAVYDEVNANVKQYARETLSASLAAHDLIPNEEKAAELLDA